MREIDVDDLTWSCAQAFAGLGEGGARSVRIDPGWADAVTDAELAAATRAAR